MANSVDSDEADHYEPQHWDLRCLQIHLFSFFILLQFDFYAPACPGHEMAVGHIESYLSVCVCVCFRLCVPESCPAHDFVLLVGFGNNLAQMIIITRHCVACKNRVEQGQMSRSQFTLKLSA